MIEFILDPRTRHDYFILFHGAKVGTIRGVGTYEMYVTVHGETSIAPSLEAAKDAARKVLS